jgi:hypothetical protein
VQVSPEISAMSQFLVFGLCSMCLVGGMFLAGAVLMGTVMFKGNRSIGQALQQNTPALKALSEHMYKF